MKNSSQQVESGADFNVRMLRPLARYILDHHGRDALDSLATQARITANEAMSGNKWISLAQMEVFFAAAYELLGKDNNRFLAACSYRMGQAYGPLRMLFWASTPKMVYKAAMKTSHIVTSNGYWKITDEGSQWLRIAYRCNQQESKLLCMGRKANILAMPQLWGLAQARVVEHTCSAKGDELCEYSIHWQPNWRWLSSLGGLVVGLLAAWVLTSCFGFGSSSWVNLPLLGAVAAGILELVRVRRADRAFVAESHRALEELRGQEAEARREIVSLHRRQQQWNRLTEMQLAERDEVLKKLLDKAGEAEEKRVVSLRGFTHDMRSPLAMLRIMHGILDHHRATIDDARPGLLEEHEKAIDQMSKLVRKLLDVGKSIVRPVTMSPERFEIAPLVDRLRRRMQALVFGRDIKVHVFATRETPEEITTDPLLFDLITDNLMTNAARHTRRGNITIEIDGVPGYLTLKISDTGTGFDKEQNDADLSVVARLLDEIGGRLEVMSMPGAGITVLVNLPRTLARADQPGASRNLADEVAPVRKTGE